jgi:hypothetical protein
VGAKLARGKYLFILDHDVELSNGLLKKIVSLIKEGGKKYDAWYIPYKIIAKGFILNKVRNFEEMFYTKSIIAAPRLIKRNIFWRTENQYDPLLNSGPADWDLTLQLKILGINIGYLNYFVYHHEENMSFWNFLTKKVIYSKGGELYKKKWKNKNKQIYNSIVVKQYSPYYRLFGIFIDNGNWIKLITNLHLYILFLFIKVTISAIYFLRGF